MTPTYIHKSLDVFPIEFLNMKLFHQTVFGEDIFQDVNIKNSNLLCWFFQIKKTGIIFRSTLLREGVRHPCWIGIYRPGCVQTLLWKAWRNELKKRKIKCRPRWLIPGPKTKRRSRKATLFSFDRFRTRAFKKVFFIKFISGIRTKT